MNQEKQRFLYVIVFSSGMVTLASELSASRLLGPVFGTSNVIWASIIGLILLYLTVGYFIGGRLADRDPRPLTFYTLICWGAFTIGLIPAAARPVLAVAAEAVLDVQGALVVGSFAVTLILFALPITLLGMVSPFAIRLAISDPEQAGQISGRIYAISTVGSLLGTFLPVLVLIPLMGTTLTFITLSAFLLLVAMIGLVQVEPKRALWLAWMPVVLLLLAIFLPRGNLRPPPEGAELIFEQESAYNYIQVARWGEANVLLLNEGQGIHSIYYPNFPDFLQTDGTWDYFLVAPYFNEDFSPEEVTSMAMIGLAGGTTPKQYTALYGPIPIDGVEIDPVIVEAGRRYFDMNEPNLNVIVQDGRIVLNQIDTRYDVINVDAYKLPYIPWHLTTVEFFSSVHDHLTERGVVAINVGRTVQDRSLINTLAATMGVPFASVHVMDVPGTCNSIMVGTVQPTTPENLAANLAALPADTHPLIATVIANGYAAVQPTPSGGQVLTDDRAAVELLTDMLLVNFVLSGSSSLPCA